MAQHEYDKPLISYKVKTNDKYLICGSLGWESSIPRGPGPGALSGLLPLPSDSSSVNKLHTRDGVTQAGGRLKRKHERRACLLCGPWLRNSQWLAVSYTCSLSIFCVLCLTIWETHGVFTSLSVPKLSTLYLGLTLSPSPQLPQSEHVIGTRPLAGKKFTSIGTMRWCQLDLHKVKALGIHPNVPLVITPLTR